MGRPKIIAYTALWAALLGIFPGVAYAGLSVQDRARSAAIQFSWTTGQSRDCGFSCLYKKANEIQSLEAIYSLRKLSRLDALKSRADAATDDAVRDAANDEVRENLRGFCIPGGETIDACFKRYKDFTFLRLKKTTAMIQQNSVNASALYEMRKNVVMSIDGVGGMGPGMETPIAPHVPTFDELQQQRTKQAETLQGLGADDYVEWQGKVPHEPSLDDFVMYTEQATADGRKLRVPDTSCKLPICHDRTAYEAAKSAFELKRADYEKDYGYLEKKPAHWENPKTLDATTEGKASIEEFNEARAKIVEVANDAIMQGKGKAAPVAPSATASTDPKRALAGQAPITGQEQVLKPKPSADADDIYVGMTPETLKANIEALENPGAAQQPQQQAGAAGAGGPAPASTAASGGAAAGAGDSAGAADDSSSTLP